MAYSTGYYAPYGPSGAPAPKPAAPKPPNTLGATPPPAYYGGDSVYEAGKAAANDNYAAAIAYGNSQKPILSTTNNMMLDRFNRDLKFGTGKNQTQSQWLQQAQQTGVGRYGADLNRGMGRIGQDAAMQYADTREDMRNRGMTHSTVQTGQLGRDALGFQRQREDLNTTTSRGIEDLNTQTSQGMQGIQWDQTGLNNSIADARADQGINYATSLGEINRNMSDAERMKNQAMTDLMLEHAQRKADYERQAYLDKMNAMYSDTVGGQD